MAQIVSGHKTRTVFGCRVQRRTVDSEEKEPFMSLPSKMLQIYFG